ncbi:MAG: dipeptidase PepV [Chthonomonadaceae bacterium]|nr:dipeptidase PepV [Chthonomonadaceae bacterium]
MTLLTPTDPQIQKLYDWVDAHHNEIVEALQGVLQIRSLEAPAVGDNAPFGQPVRDALDYTLTLCDSLGFTTKDVDGYAGHAEMGSGEKMVMAMGHLDVVPEGEGWRYEPYGATIENGFIYARGASDDKGPTYAALFGAKAILDCELPISKRIRVLFGCNEESGFKCVEHYWGMAKEEVPEYAFTPDASFPLIYAEKGIATFVLEKELPTEERPLKIASASGGLRPNMVPESAVATLLGETEALDAAEELLTRFWDKNITFVRGAETITVMAQGKSAHGARPTLGDNAIARLARALAELDLAEKEVWLDFVAETVDTTGVALGIDAKDDVAGRLTCNMGILEYTPEGKVRVTYNIRYPVKSTLSELVSGNKPVLEKYGWTLAKTDDSVPLYVPLDKDPVKTLLKVYREATGDTTSQPGTMGGGTYARATPNAVAFGAAFPGGTDGPAHEPDERIAIETLLNATKIYAQSLYELAK